MPSQFFCIKVGDEYFCRNVFGNCTFNKNKTGPIHSVIKYSQDEIEIMKKEVLIGNVSYTVETVD